MHVPRFTGTSYSTATSEMLMAVSTSRPDQAFRVGGHMRVRPVACRQHSHNHPMLAALAKPIDTHRGANAT